MTEPTNWKAIGEASGLFLIGALTAYNSWKATRTAKTVAVIHTLTNSAMSTQMKMVADLTAAKAVLTNSKVDVEAAEVALKAYQEHLAKQAVVDAG